MWSRILLFLLLMTGLLITGCASTSVTGSWKNPEYNGTLRSPYIVGISENETIRRIFEDGFRSKLQTFGISGIASYKDLPVSKKTEESAILKRARSNGADSLLMARVIGKRTEEVVSPGRITSYEYRPRRFYDVRKGYYPAPYYRYYGSYYPRTWEAIYEPATVTEFKVVTIEANIFDVGTQELLWSAQLETIIDDNMNQLINEFIDTVIQDLRTKDII